ncbi:MAG: peptidoglycan-binding domain-containing protein [Microthrixaceae bacterium]
MHTRSIRSVAITLLAVSAVVGLSACGDSTKDTTTTSAAADSTTTTAAVTTTTSNAEAEATKKFDEQIQRELQEVGCYSGSVDGILGPKSDAAILEFQRAEGLAADGELGPETEAALKKAVAAGKKVCGGSSTTTTAKPGSTTTTTVKPSPTACTATVLIDALGGDAGTSLTNFVCSGNYAAGTISGGEKFILEKSGGYWVRPNQDPCGSASAGLPPIILEDGCPS